MSYAEIIARCENEPLFFFSFICWAAFFVCAFAAIGWRFGKSLVSLLPRKKKNLSSVFPFFQFLA